MAPEIFRAPNAWCDECENQKSTVIRFAEKYVCADCLREVLAAVAPPPAPVERDALTGTVVGYLIGDRTVEVKLDDEQSWPARGQRVRIFGDDAAPDERALTEAQKIEASEHAWNHIVEERPETCATTTREEAIADGVRVLSGGDDSGNAPDWLEYLRAKAAEIRQRPVERALTEAEIEECARAGWRQMYGEYKWEEWQHQLWLAGVSRFLDGDEAAVSLPIVRAAVLAKAAEIRQRPVEGTMTDAETARIADLCDCRENTVRAVVEGRVDELQPNVVERVRDALRVRPVERAEKPRLTEWIGAGETQARRSRADGTDTYAVVANAAPAPWFIYDPRTGGRTEAARGTAPDLESAKRAADEAAAEWYTLPPVKP